jgi:hypothetical protein
VEGLPGFQFSHAQQVGREISLLHHRMRVLLLAIVLYLIAVVIVLYVKPRFMFHEDGTWKEFGLQNYERYTPFPMWLFCIVIALFSYAISQFIVGESGTTQENLEMPVNTPTPLTLPKRANTIVETLKPGYYVLNREGTAADGVPKYIYIGEAPLESQTDV